MIVWKKKTDSTMNENSENLMIFYEKSISVELKLELEKFFSWVLENYTFEKPLVIDIVNKQYLIIDGKKSEVAFFYSEMDDYLKDPDSLMPYAKVSVGGFKTKWYIKDIIRSLVEVLTDYFSWTWQFTLDDDTFVKTVDEILEHYFNK